MGVTEAAGVKDSSTAVTARCTSRWSQTSTLLTSIHKIQSCNRIFDVLIIMIFSFVSHVTAYFDRTLYKRFTLPGFFFLIVLSHLYTRLILTVFLRKYVVLSDGQTLH